MILQVIPVLPYALSERSHVPENQGALQSRLSHTSLPWPKLLKLPFSREESACADDPYTVQWWNSTIFAVYGAFILLGSPVCGWLTDRASSKAGPFYVGLAALAVGTTLFGVARDPRVLLLSRALQGASSAVVYTVGLALVVDTVDRDEIGQWMGTALSCSSIGVLISVPLGGILYARAGYMAVFAVVLGLIGIDIIMRAAMIQRPAAKVDEARVSSYGSVQKPATAIAPSFSDSSSARSDPDKKLGAKRRMPVLLRLLFMPRAAAALYGIFVNVSVLVALDSVLPLFVKENFGWDSLAAGSMFFCLVLPTLGGPLVGWLCDRFGPRWITVAGCALTAPPIMAMQFVTGHGTAQKVLLCTLLTICGMPLFQSPPYLLIPARSLLPLPLVTMSSKIDPIREC